MKLRQLQLFYHSMRCTRPHQLFNRLALQLKRNTLARVANPAMIARTAMADPGALALNSKPPQAPFAPRQYLVKSLDNGIELSFLNRVRSLRDSNRRIDWRPEELKTGTRLWLLNLHYTEFLEGLPADEAGRVMLDWIEQVKPFEPGYWMDNWNSYSLSIRVVVWMQQLAARDLGLSEAEHALVKGSLIAQLRFLRKNLELDIGGNHLIKNITALIWASAFFEGPEADRWGALGRQLLAREVDEQILADGMHYELSPTYHNQVFADLLNCYAALPEGAARQRLGLSLDKMAQLCADFRHPDGGVSLFNDCGLYFAYKADDCLGAYQQLRGRAVPAQRHIVLRTSGYYGFRSNNDLFLLDCAELAPDYLPAHGHGDALAFEWSVNGQRVFVDAGVFEYNPGPKRAYSRATNSHNTVNLDGEDQSEFWKAFRVGRRAHITQCGYQANDQGFRLVGAHDGYARLRGRPVHQRSFEVTAQEITITDSLQGGDGQTAQAVLLLHPDARIESVDANTLNITVGAAAVQVRASAPIRLESAHWHPDQGIDLATQKLCIDYGYTPCNGKIELARMEHGQDPTRHPL